MNSTTIIKFSRSCPTCGRRIQIRSSLLGHTVSCPHCKAEFTAMAADESVGCVDDASRLMDRVESMLTRSETETRHEIPVTG